MVDSVLKTKTKPLSYKRVPFNDLKLKKPSSKVSRVTGKAMKMPKMSQFDQAMQSEKPVNAAAQPKGTVFGAKIQ